MRATARKNRIRKQTSPRIMAAVLLASVAHLSLAKERDSMKLPEKSRFHLFLLVGQSNMAGRGTVEDGDKVAHPRVLSLDKNEQWAPAVDPIHFDKPVAGVCLGRTFGIVLAEKYPQITIGLIPCAAGGSPISVWEPGQYWEQTRSRPYDDAIRRAKAAMKSGTLRGILWHQGESDSKPGLAEIYEEKLHALIERFRKDLNAPDVPFIVGQLGSFPERPWDDSRKMVDAALRKLPEMVKRTAFVSSEGLTAGSDQLHFDAESLREFGRRYAKAYFGLAEPTGAADRAW